MARDAGDVGAVLACGVVADDVGNEDAAQGADDGGLICGALGAAEARPEAEEEGAGDDVAHGDVGDGNVFDERAVDGLKREAVATFKDTVGDGDVDEATVGFCSALDAAGATDLAEVGLGAVELLEGSVEHGAQAIGAGDVTVGDTDVLG